MAQLNRGTFTERLLPASLPRGSSASNPSSSSSSSSSWPTASALSRRLPEPREAPAWAPRGAWLKAARCARAPRQTPVWALASNFPPSETIHVAQFPPYDPFWKMVLLFLDDPRSPPACNWFRGRDQSEKNHILSGQFDSVWGFHRINQTGPAFTGREDVAKGCSLIIRKLWDSDAGPYTVSMMGLGGKDPITGAGNLQLSYAPFISHPEAARLIQFPPNPRVGQSVYLYLDDIPSPTDCSWFRGKDQHEEGRIFRAKFGRISHTYLIDLKGAAHRGREEVWRACALVIRKVEASDAGPYTISMGDEWDEGPIMAWRELRVSS